MNGARSRDALKLVLHVDQADRWSAALGNVENLTRDYPDARVRMVVNGSAVYPLAGANDLAERIAEYAGKGVTFQVCANSLRSHAVPRASLPDSAVIVPAGVVALAQAQEEGFAYVKPPSGTFMFYITCPLKLKARVTPDHPDR